MTYESEHGQDLYLRGVAAARAHDNAEALLFLEWALQEWDAYGEYDREKRTEVNLWLSSWANYFRHGYPRQAFRRLNWFTQERLLGHLRRRSQRPFRPPEGTTFYAHLQALGLKPL